MDTVQTHKKGSQVNWSTHHRDALADRLSNTPHHGATATHHRHRAVTAQEDNRMIHSCKGVDLDLTEEHAMSVDDCLRMYNATSIKDISPSAFAVRIYSISLPVARIHNEYCVGKCVMEKTGLVDSSGKPHKENIFNMITDALPVEVHDDLQIKFEKCLDEETEEIDPLDDSCVSYLPLCMCIHLAFLESSKCGWNLATAKFIATEEVSYCPRTFDGWSCWNDTPAGETANAPCPWFVTGFEPGRLAHKECLRDGSWFKHPLTNLTWSNYTTCVDLEALQVRNYVLIIHAIFKSEFVYQNVNLVYEVGYFVSVCALILSLFIFCRFRSLSCTRVTIHKHLFASFIINNSLWLVWYRTVVSSHITVNELNQVYCAVLHILTHYFMMANYFWMFCEGFYLHTLLVYAFTRAESKLLTWFYVLDPRLKVVAAHLRTCVHMPACQPRVPHQHRSRARDEAEREQARHAHRLPRDADPDPAAGPALLHNPVPARRESNKWAAVMYEYVAAFTSSLQGLAVSLIFCFCNGEVLAVLKRHVCGTNSTCGGKLLGNLRTRMLRNTTNGNSRANRQSVHSCSPTTTVMVTEVY
ncbi:Calcitonin-like peptide type 1 receptor [Orchesella cincta]|uniref:Calcitonin-like peptide type 1 receptor n=1 Tax=Orchesella cincta TaxID=48709 RepID=A0A1D2MLN2_ORCCI|nr:Calcitonin-like peptide type 1 receptor [Orchesella cincta]